MVKLCSELRMRYNLYIVINTSETMYHCLLRTLFVGLITIAITACAGKPVAKDFGVSANIITIGSQRDGVFYMLQLDINDEVPENALLFIRYEELDKPGEFKELALGSLGQARVLNFRSMPSSAVKLDYFYTLQVRLQTSETNDLVAAYNAFLSAELSPKVSKLLAIKLL